MAENELQIKPQRLVSSTTFQNNKNQRKFYNHVLFKPLIIIFFLVMIQFFPSEPPNFVSQSILTRSWEVIYLIFVGIIVSYGLFSRKNDDPDDGKNSKFDHAQSYMSRLFHVDDETDDNNVKKIETWKSKYVRNEPMTVVAEKSCVLDDVDDNCGVNDEKPLLLPVRSLKSRVCDEKNGDFVDYEGSRVYNRSNTSPIDKRFPKNTKSLSRNGLIDENDGDFGDYGGSRVYTRSNTGQIDKGLSKSSKTMSRNDLIGLVHGEDSRLSYRGHGRSNSSSTYMEFSGDSSESSRIGSLKSRNGVCDNENMLFDGSNEVSRSLYRSNSGLSSRGSSSHSRRHSNGDFVELDDQKREDEMKGIRRSGSVNTSVGVSSEPTSVSGSNSEVPGSLYRSNSSLNLSGFSSHSRRHSNVDYEELNGVLENQKEKVGECVVLPSPIPWRSRSGRMEIKGESNDSTTANVLPPSLEESESFCTIKPRLSPSNSSSFSYPKELSPTPKESSPRKVSTSSLESQAKSVQDVSRRKSNYSSRLPPPPPPPPPPPRFQTSNRSRLARSPSRRDEEISSSLKDMKSTMQGELKDFSWQNNVESSKNTNEEFDVRIRNVESPETNSVGYNSMTKESYSEYPKETRDFLEHVLLETDDESESEAENHREEITETRTVDEGHSETVNDEGPDVDKKADEFIAKFREQIRLQRIESIKRSTGQLKRTSVR